MQVYKDPTDEVPPFLAEKYDREAHRYWDKFYNRNGANFFKDRHYLDDEFPELSNPGLVLLEVGCGAGNTIYPVLKSHPDIRIYACDFAPKAVDLVKSHPSHDPDRVTAFTADITTQHPFDAVIEPGTVDIITMVFVLSAITPDKMPKAVGNIASVLKAGGKVLFRDYAEGDLAQVRLAADGKQQRISTRFYVRGDGTCAYYFDPQGLRDLFEIHGLKCSSMEVHERQLENRKKNQVMERRWIQAVFSLSGGTQSRPSPSIPNSSIKLSGAAGRLASDSRCARYSPQLPDSLDPADVTAAEISPATYGNVADYEAELEREFAGIVGKDTDEVVAQEVANLQARGGTGFHLFGMQELEQAMGSSGCSGGSGARFWGVDPGGALVDVQSLSVNRDSPDEAVSPDLEPVDTSSDLVEVNVSGAVVRLQASFNNGRSSMVLGAAPTLAREIASSGNLLEGKTVLDLWCDGSPICSLAAARHASRIFASVRKEGELRCLRSNLRLNASQVIIERIHPCCLGTESDALPYPKMSWKAGGDGVQVVLCSSSILSDASQASARSVVSMFRLARHHLQASAGGMLWIALIPQSDEHMRTIDNVASEESFIRCLERRENLPDKPWFREMVHRFEYMREKF